MIQFTIEAVSDLHSLQKCLDEMYLTVFNPYTLQSEMNQTHISFRDGLNIHRIQIKYNNPSKSVERYCSLLCDRIEILSIDFSDENNQSFFDKILKDINHEIEHISTYSTHDSDYEDAVWLIEKCLRKIKGTILRKKIS